jgi:pilus assembly protein CpaF
MGPTLARQGKITSFLGAKGGVGCSILTSLLARLAAKKSPKKIAVIDGIPFPNSTLPSYLSLPSVGHHLTQLQPYQNRIPGNMLENFFPYSPEGTAYIPVKANDETQVSFHDVFPLIQKLDQWFFEIFIDLSSFPSDQYFDFLGKSDRVFIISSLEPTSLAAVKQWEKRLLPFHFHLQNFGIIFNQENPGRSMPKDIFNWAKNFSYIGTIPFLGENLSIDLFESQTFTSVLEKTLLPILEKTLVSQQFVPASGSNEPLGENQEKAPSDSDPISLEQIHQLHQKLLDQLRKSGVMKDQKSTGNLQRQALEPNAREILDQLIQGMEIQNRETRQRLVAETLNLAFGLGPLEPLLQNEEITEIMVNGPGQIHVEKKGILEKTDLRFLDDQQLRTVIERILAPIGRRIDESQPYVDGRLLDGSRINAIIPPLSLNGPVLTIRKFSKRKLKIDDLVTLGSLTQEAADFLGACVKAKKNIVVSGGTGSGKTTLLNILSNFIPANERIVTIEDSAELQLSQDHVIRLEGRPSNLEGKGQVAIRDLVINALRMRPDRIVVGECRGGEALDMLQAMNTGHDGSLTTAHANSPRDVLSRLETMCLFTGLDLPLKAVREQIARAVHLIVQQNRLPNGKRAVTQISQIQGMEGEIVITQDVFKSEQGQGLVRLPFAPSFIEDLNSIGYQWPGYAERTKNL